ncbi:MAG: hypothetical protein EOM20_07395 [Spartobacteria bacterium]|nr:hypothetical protein [Spartobacteria bacterium]
MTKTLSFIAAQLVCSVLLAMEGPPPILNPATYTSPSGEYSLTVDPSDLHGRGAADYRFTKHGEVLWTNCLPFTLWEAGVSDSGYVGGYAYSHGWRGFSKKAGLGDFRVVVLSPTGTLLREHVFQREASRFMDTPPNPLARGLLIDPAGNRLLIRIADPEINTGIEQWWVYDLGNGKRLDTVTPESYMGDTRNQHLAVIAAAAVPSTPLILVHWWKYDQSRAGAVFTLLNEAAKPVWTLTLDGDYSMPSDEAREDDVRRVIREKGGILGVDTNGAFHLHFVKEGLRVSYGVKQLSHDMWEVTKITQAPYMWEEGESQTALCPLLSPDKVGDVVLAASSSAEDGEFGDLVAFDFDQQGDICAVRFGCKTPPSLLLVSQKGEIIHELPLPVGTLPEQVRMSNPANVGGKRFVVAISDRGIGGTARWFLADFSQRTIERLTNAICPDVAAVAGFPDGGFVALTTRHKKYTMTDGLFFFDGTGKQLWSKEDVGYSRKPDDLLSPEDLVACGSNTIAVLDNVRRTIQIFDTKGDIQKFIDLKTAWGRQPNYPTDIAAERDGGFLVYDFNAEHTLVRLDREGAILAESVPKFQDERTFRVIDGVKRSPQGDLWTSDGDALLRLSTNATVDLILGEEPLPSVLGAPARWWVGPNDQVYVSDGRTKSLHVFNSLGKHLGACIPMVEDLTQISHICHVSVSRDGDAFMMLGVCTQQYLRFDKKLMRIGWAGLDVDTISQEWYFHPTNDLCWFVGYNDVFLVRDLRDIVRRISRRSDGRWLECPGQAAVAPDGALALLARSKSGETTINTYDPAGNACSTFPVSTDPYVAMIAYDGQRVYIRQKANVRIYGADGALLGDLALEHMGLSQNCVGPFLAAKGRELWFISPDDMTIHRYANL